MGLENVVKDRIKELFTRLYSSKIKKDYEDIKEIEWGEIVNIEKLCISLKVEEQMKSFPQSFIQKSSLKDNEQTLAGISPKENPHLTSVLQSTPASVSKSSYLTLEQVRPTLEVMKVSLPQPLASDIAVTNSTQNNESRTQSRCEVETSTPPVTPKPNLPVMVNTPVPSAVTTVSEKPTENVHNEITKSGADTAPHHLNANGRDNPVNALNTSLVLLVPTSQLRFVPNTSQVLPNTAQVPPNTSKIVWVPNTVSALNTTQVLSSRVLVTNAVCASNIAKRTLRTYVKEKKKSTEVFKLIAIKKSHDDVRDNVDKVQPGIQETETRAKDGVLSGLGQDFNSMGELWVTEGMEICEKNLNHGDSVQIFVSSINLVTVQIPKNFAKFCKGPICIPSKNIISASWPSALLIASPGKLAAIKLLNVFQNNVESHQARVRFNFNSFSNAEKTLLNVPMPLKSVWIRSSHIITVFQRIKNSSRVRHLIYEDQREPKSSHTFTYILERMPVDVPVTTPNCGDLVNLIPNSVVNNSTTGLHIVNTVNENRKSPSVLTPRTQLPQTDDLPEIGNEDKTDKAEIDTSCKLSDVQSCSDLVPEIITVEDDSTKSSEIANNCEVQIPEQCLNSEIVDSCEPTVLDIDSEAAVMGEEIKTKAKIDTSCQLSDVQSFSSLVPEMITVEDDSAKSSEITKNCEVQILEQCLNNEIVDSSEPIVIDLESEAVVMEEEMMTEAEIDISCKLSEDVQSCSNLVPEVITLEDDSSKSSEITKNCDVQLPEQCLPAIFDSCKPAMMDIDSEVVVMEEEIKATSTEMECNEVCSSSEVRSHSSSEASSSETEDISESIRTADYYIQRDPKLLQAQIIIEDIENCRFKDVFKDRPCNKHNKRPHRFTSTKSRRLQMYKSSMINARSKSAELSRSESSLAVRKSYKTRSQVHRKPKVLSSGIKVLSSGIEVNGRSRCSMSLRVIKTELV